MRIAIASDHAAIELKAILHEWLLEDGHEVADLGPKTDKSVDYPDYGYDLAAVVAEGTAEFGVALCGSGIGISIAVNRNPGVRCALAWSEETARLGREHNDANVVSVGGRPFEVHDDQGRRHSAWAVTGRPRRSSARADRNGSSQSRSRGAGTGA